MGRLSLALANLATLTSLTILISVTFPAVVFGLKIEASTESFTDGFAEVENGDLLVNEGWFLHKLKPNSYCDILIFHASILIDIVLKFRITNCYLVKPKQLLLFTGTHLYLRCLVTAHFSQNRFG